MKIIKSLSPLLNMIVLLLIFPVANILFDKFNIGDDGKDIFWINWCFISLKLLIFFLVLTLTLWVIYLIKNSKRADFYIALSSLSFFNVGLWFYLMLIGMFIAGNQSMANSWIVLSIISIMLGSFVEFYFIKMKAIKNEISKNSSKYDFKKMVYREGGVSKSIENKSKITKGVVIGGAIGLFATKLNFSSIENIQSVIRYLPEESWAYISAFILCEFIFLICISSTYKSWVIYKKCKSLGGVMVIESMS